MASKKNNEDNLKNLPESKNVLVQGAPDIQKNNKSFKKKLDDYQAEFNKLDKLSTKQKIILAFTAIIPPVAIAVYFLIKRNNNIQKNIIENKVSELIENKGYTEILNHKIKVLKETTDDYKKIIPTAKKDKNIISKKKKTNKKFTNKILEQTTTKKLNLKGRGR